jgi:hypothetical protein
MKYSHQMNRQREEQIDYSKVWVGSALDEGSEIVAAPAGALWILQSTVKATDRPMKTSLSWFKTAAGSADRPTNTTGMT